MPEELPKQASVPPESKPKRTISSTIRDSVLEFRPEAKPWREFWVERFPGMKLRKWVVFSIFALAIAFTTAYTTRLWLRGKESFLRGQLLTTSNELALVQKKVDDERRSAKQDSETQASKFQGQINEERRQYDNKLSSKDAELGQLKTEKASLQSRLDFLAAQSANFIGALTNLSVYSSSTASNRQQFDMLSADLQATMKTLQDYRSLAETNVGLLANLKSSEPRWQIFVDGLPMPTDSGDYNVTMALTGNVEVVVIGVRNMGERAADRVKVDLSFSSSYTNTIEVGSGWEGQPALKIYNGRWIPNSDRIHYAIISDGPVTAAGGGFVCPPIAFKQSADQPHDYAIAIVASSGGSKSMPIGCFLHFKPGVQEPSLGLR